LKHIVVTVGIPASGKSTLANEYGNQGYSIVEKDHFRKARYQRGETWSSKLESEVNEEHKDRIIHLMKMGLNIIVSDTNLNVKTRLKYVNMAEAFGYTLNYEIVRCDYETALARNGLRSKADIVPDHIMHTMGVKMIEQFPTPYIPKVAPTAYVFDIDGTLAHAVDRGHYDWSKVGQDRADTSTVDVCKALYDQGDNIILLSGRDAVCMTETIKWLELHDIKCHRLLMRPAGNNTKDSLLKHDMFHKHVANFYNVKGVFDDRPSVCRMWRGIGVKTFQVGDPHTEF